MAARSGVKVLDDADTLVPVFVQVVDSDELESQATGVRHAWEVWADDATTGTNLLIAEVVSNVVSVYSAAAFTKNMGTTGNRWSTVYGVNVDASGYYTSGSHGVGIGTQDIATGTGATDYFWWDSSTRTLFLRGLLPIISLVDETAASRFFKINEAAGYWQIDSDNTGVSVWFTDGVGVSNGKGIGNVNSGGAFVFQSTSNIDWQNNVGAVVATFINGSVTTSRLDVAGQLRVGTTTLTTANQGSVAFGGASSAEYLFFDVANARLDLNATTSTIPSFRIARGQSATFHEITIDNNTDRNLALRTIGGPGVVIQPGGTTRYTFGAASTLFAPVLASSQITSMFRWDVPANTGQTAESRLWDFGVATSSTITWTTAGAIATERAFVIARQTAAATAPTQTFTDIATMTIVGDWIAGANVAYTRNMSLWVQAGWSRFAGGVTVGTATAAVPGAGVLIVDQYYRGGTAADLSAQGDWQTGLTGSNNRIRYDQDGSVAGKLEFIRTGSVTAALGADRCATGWYLTTSNWATSSIGSKNGVGHTWNALLGAAEGRYTVTTAGWTGSATSVFNGEYENTIQQTTIGVAATLTVDFNPQLGWTVDTNTGFIYTQGLIALNFYSTSIATDITIEFYKPVAGTDTWVTEYTTTTNASNPFVYDVGAHNYVKKVRLTLNHASVAVWLTEFEWYMTRSANHGNDSTMTGDVMAYATVGQSVAWPYLRVHDTAWATACEINRTGFVRVGTDTHAVGQGEFSAGILSTGQYMFFDVAATTVLDVANTGGSALIRANGAGANNTGFAWKQGSTEEWYLYQSGSTILWLRDIVNSRMVMSFTQNATASSAVIEARSRFQVTDGSVTHHDFPFAAGQAWVLNEQGLDIDGRIEGDTNQNLTHWDAGLDTIGFGTTAVSGTFMKVFNAPTITSGTFLLQENTARWQGASDSTAAIYGHSIIADMNAAFNLTTLVGMVILARDQASFSSGTISNMRGLNVTSTHSGAGAVTTWTDAFIATPTGTGAGTVGTWQQLLLQDLSGLTITNRIGIRQQGTNAHNRFQGQTRFGADSAPGAMVDVLQTTGLTGTNPIVLRVVGSILALVPSGSEVVDAQFNWTRDVQMDSQAGPGGTTATQRSTLFQAPNFTASNVGNGYLFTTAATVAVAGAPTAGAGVTITNPLAWWVQAGLSKLDGGLTVVGNLTTGVTNQQVVYSVNGILSGDADFTFDGTTVTVAKVLAINNATASGIVTPFDFQGLTSGELKAVLANTRNSGNTGDLTLELSSGGTSGGSPSIRMLVTGSYYWSIGQSNGATDDPFVIAQSSGLASNRYLFMVPAGGTNPYISWNHDQLDVNYRIKTEGLSYAFWLDGASAVGNLALLANAEPNWQSGVNVMFWGNANTAPTGNPSGGGFAWVEAGAWKYRGTSGTITTVAAAEPHCPRCGADYVHEWESAKHGYLAVCMPCLLTEFERLGGDRSRVTIPRKAAA